MVCLMNDVRFTVFETAIGACAVAWSDGGLRAVGLPEKTAAEMRARLRRKFPDARESEPPPEVRQTIEAIAALLAGERRDLSGVMLDMSELPEFNRRVYEIARSIGPGATLTYGEIAARLGEPGLARDVGQALGQNPFPIVVPCHRVLAAGGKLGGFSARGGVATKLRLLEIEGALKPEAPMLFGELPRAVRRA
jgi:methylated-DNA-[protein]-cysteine S-methyltransferase